MSKMPEYDATAGFPAVHVEVFKAVAGRNRVVISSRELNPLCTDLVLENYAAKGFHIKAKTCDWGPMAGFVPEDYRFTKGSQALEAQKRDIDKAFGHHAKCVPLYISDARLKKLAHCGLLKAVKQTGHLWEVEAGPADGKNYRFTLVRLTVIPPGCDAQMWAVCYHPQQDEASSSGRLVAGEFPKWPGLRPVYGMTNADAPAALGAKAAVAGDYDLWCIFPHSSLGATGISDRLMTLRSTLTGKPSKLVAERAQAAGLVFASGAEKAAIAEKQEDPHLGNISLMVMKIRNELNAGCRGRGYTAGNVVQHSDYGGNPFGSIDFPLIFFVPDPRQDFARAEHYVADNMGSLKTVLMGIQKSNYVLKLNPAWSVPFF